MPDLPLLEEPATNPRDHVEVGRWEHEVVGRVALGSEICGGVSEHVAHDACMTGCPPYLDCRAREGQGGCGLADVAEKGGLVRVSRA